MDLFPTRVHVKICKKKNLGNTFYILWRRFFSDILHTANVAINENNVFSLTSERAQRAMRVLPWFNGKI